MSSFGLNTGTLVNIAFFIIFIIAIVFCVRQFLRPLKGRITALQEIIVTISKYNKNSIAFNYENLRAEMDSTILKSSWELYERTILKAADDEGQVIPYATQESADFITASGVLAGLPSGLYKNFAGICTGLGILGTFVGLTVGLLGLDTSTTQSLQQGIQGLLSGMTAAFLTSIIGIGIGLCYNYYYSDKFKKIEELTAKVCEKIDGLFDTKSVHELLYDNWKESKESTEEIKNFNEALVVRLGNLLEQSAEASRQAMDQSLDKSFKENLLPVFNNLTAAIDRLNNGGVAELREGLQKGAGEQLTGFAGSIERLQANLEETVKQTQNVTNESHAQLQNAMDGIVARLQEVGNSISETQKLSADENNKAMKELIEELNTNLKAAVSQMVESSTNANKALVAATGKAAETVDSLSSTAEANMEKRQKAMNDAADTMKQTLSDTLENIRKEMQQQNAALKVTLDNLNQVMGSNKDVMVQAGKTADTFAKASAPMSQVANTMGLQVNKVVDASEMFTQKVGDHIIQLSNASKSTETSLAEIRRAIQEMQKEWTAYAGHFANVSGEMERTFKTLQDGLKAYNAETKKALGENLESYDKHIAGSLDALRSLTGELSDSADDLVKAADALSGITRKR